MRRLRLRLSCALILAAVGLLTAAGAAWALAPATVDCSHHNQLTRHYTVAQLQSALATMPADVKEYTACYSVIQNQLSAQLGGLKGHGSAKAGSGSSFPTALVVALVVIVLAGGGASYAAYRRNRSGGGPPEPPAATRSRPI